MSGFNRREFAKGSLAGLSLAAMGDFLRAEQTKKSPNERLNLAIVGTANRAAANLADVAKENIVALCDVDESNLEKARAQFPKAAAFKDYRKMLERSGYDAVVVSTPDHTHALPTAIALRQGLHVYCEKPLTHTVEEARVVRKLAEEHKAVTQMGTQIHALPNYRRAVEAIKSGAIGPVKRVHVWNSGRPSPGTRVAMGTPPANLDYDLWLGPAPVRPYHASHLHFHWRWWWDFGGGVLADLGCHYIDLPFWALSLGQPTSVEAKGKKDYKGDNEVPGVMQVDWTFPARGDQPPVHLTWYHGGWKPAGADKYGMGSAVLFVGEKGELVADYTRHKLYPEEKFKGLTIPKTIPDSIGHHEEWLQAIRSGGPTTCPFSYSGVLTETVLLGNAVYRAGGGRIEWDGQSGAFKTESSEASRFLAIEPRSGWAI